MKDLCQHEALRFIGNAPLHGDGDYYMYFDEFVPFGQKVAVPSPKWPDVRPAHFWHGLTNPRRRRRWFNAGALMGIPGRLRL